VDSVKRFRGRGDLGESRAEREDGDFGRWRASVGGVLGRAASPSPPFKGFASGSPFISHLGHK